MWAESSVEAGVQPFHSEPRKVELGFPRSAPKRPRKFPRFGTQPWGWPHPSL